MKFRAAYLLLGIALLALSALVSSCSTNESDNSSVRPWNAPQDWENGMGGMDNMQHR